MRKQSSGSSAMSWRRPSFSISVISAERARRVPGW
jgi:hypothetical protein